MTLQKNCSEDDGDFLFTYNFDGRFYAYENSETERFLACYCNGTDRLLLSQNKDNTCQFIRTKINKRFN